MIPLAIIKAAGLPKPDDKTLEAIIEELEKQWEELAPPQKGDYFDDTACLSSQDAE